MKNLSRSLRSLFWCAFSLWTAACVTLPGSHKSAFIMISEREERDMGNKAYSEILQKERLSTNERWKEILFRVGQRIAAQAPVNYHWEYSLIQSKEMNAFCLPGGKVAFYTGIIPVLQNEASMALVMGHEVAHAVQRHGAQRMSQGMAIQGGLAVGSLLFGGKDHPTGNMVLAALGLGATVGVILPFSRSHESEADEIGLKYAAAAGYDPDEGYRFWQRFARETKGGVPPFLSTHPSEKSRMEHLKALAVSLQPVYESSPKYGLGETL
jgi:predicted Zn-dependent protease